MEVRYSNFSLDPKIYGSFELTGLVDLDSGFIHKNFYDVKNITYNEKMKVGNYLSVFIPAPYRKLSDTLIAEFEFDKEFLKKKLGELSSSELIKVLAIKLMLSDAKVIFLDNIDIYMNTKDLNSFLKILKSHSKEAKKNIIFSTNKIDNIIDVCERYIIAQENSIIYNGKDIDKLPIKTELSEFASLALNKKVKLNNYKDINDLLKAIYRSVKK